MNKTRYIYRRVKSRNRYKGPRDKDNGVRFVFGRAGQGTAMGGKMGTTVTEQQYYYKGHEDKIKGEGGGGGRRGVRLGWGGGVGRKGRQL